MSRPRSANWRDLIAGDFLESSAAVFAAPFVAETTPQEPGDVPAAIMGRYRLLREIGRGGMGAVWLAERADGQFEQQVALKLIKRGMDSDEILARFLRERQILARLEHPNIARLLDGGVSEDGRPWFVMELVHGERITRSCDMRRLDVESRLRIFATVCRAVQHAHRNLVVHRDLKPSNVLITERGEVKLLDFGVAKLLGEEGSDDTTHSSKALTPEYASPEQLAGQPITTASDVFQLGILLYELLTGRRPFRRNAVESDVEASSPSTEVGRVATIVHRDGTEEKVDPAIVSERRSTTPPGLRSRLRGDLDAIALRALRREPDLRYPSAEALAEDVERHLTHLPIRFGSGGWRYRAGKFVQRYRLQLTAAVLIGMVGLTAGLGYTLQIRRERDRAQREVTKATESAALLRRFFEGWSPDAADRGEVSAEVVLADAARRAKQELSHDPEMLAATLSMLGDLMSGLSRFDAADSLLGIALTMQRETPGTRPTDLAATLARRGRILTVTSRYREGEELLQRALAIYRETPGSERAEILRVQYHLAEALSLEAKYGEAEALLRDVMAASPDPDTPFATEVASKLGYVLFLTARYDEAAALLRMTLSRQRRLFGDLHLSTLMTLRHLASALRRRDDLAEAESLDRESLRIARSLFGPDHRETGIAMFSLAILLERKGDFAEAEDLVRRQVGIGRRATGAITRDRALEFRTLGGLRLIRGDLAQADSLLRHSLEIFRATDPGNLDEGDVRNRLAYVALMRRDRDAQDIYRDAVRFDLARRPGDPSFVTDGYEYLGWAARRMGDVRLAARLYERAVTLYQKELPEGHPYRVQAERGLQELRPGAR